MTDFFRNALGFDEEDYTTTKAKLLERATFTNVTESEIGLWRGVESPPEAAQGVVGERCVFAKTDEATGEVTNVDAGVFYDPSVQELRQRAKQLVDSLTSKERAELAAAAKQSYGTNAIVSVQHIVGDSRSLHSELDNANGVMQAASQFNYLEFPSPNTTPEKGITGYIYDRTQGPACATACAPGTAVRNYLVKVGSDQDGAPIRGQTRDKQLNGLADVTNFLTGGGDPDMYYEVRNGYVESTKEKLAELNRRLTSVDPNETLVPLLRVGVQEDTQVTDEAAGRVRQKHVDETGKVRWVYHIVEGKYPAFVTQVYCSALSIGYSRCQSYDDGPGPWDPFACIVLNATYEATLLIAIINTIKLLRTKRFAEGRLPRTLLTKVGGGVFANNAEWIQAAIARAASKCVAYGVPLDIRLVHYGGVEGEYQEFPTTLLASLSGNALPAVDDDNGQDQA